MDRKFLLRYDTESDSAEDMAGFFEKVVAVHRQHAIPATFFCRGGAIDGRPRQFAAFWREVAGDPLFDIQDHSYTHIGICYEAGKPLEVLQADYEKSFAAHERVFGKRPVGVSICGTSGKDGEGLSGFDATDKSRAELDMLAGLGVRMINTRLGGMDQSRQFVNYAKLGHADVMGFPSGFGDTSWMYNKDPDEGVAYIISVMEERASRDEHMPLMLHDWCAWQYAADKELTHVKVLADRARELGFELATHVECLGEESLWR